MKYTAVVSYKVTATIDVEANDFREAVGKIRRKWHNGEMEAFVDQEPKEKTLNILGLSEIDGWGQLAKRVADKAADKANWQPTLENMRSFLSDNNIGLGSVISFDRYNELINNVRKWAGYPLSQWLMDCFEPRGGALQKGYEDSNKWYSFTFDSWDDFESEWHERWP